jgi:hypothetical protein
MADAAEHGWRPTTDGALRGGPLDGLSAGIDIRDEHTPVGVSEVWHRRPAVVMMAE